MEKKFQALHDLNYVNYIKTLRDMKKGEFHRFKILLQQTLEINLELPLN
jgi:hypothetical protein